MCFTARTVEVFASGDRIAVHLRGSGDGKHTTLSDHMPSSHRRYGDWTIERILREARAIGPSTEMLCQMVLEERPHPEQGFRTCLGVVRLVRPFGATRVEAACRRALEVGAKTYGSVKSILDNHLDGQPPTGARKTRRDDVQGLPSLHANIRGSRYYH